MSHAKYIWSSLTKTLNSRVCCAVLPLALLFLTAVGFSCTVQVCNKTTFFLRRQSFNLSCFSHQWLVNILNIDSKMFAHVRKSGNYTYSSQHHQKHIMPSFHFIIWDIWSETCVYESQFQIIWLVKIIFFSKKLFYCPEWKSTFLLSPRRHSSFFCSVYSSPSSASPLLRSTTRKRR